MESDQGMIIYSLNTSLSSPSVTDVTQVERRISLQLNNALMGTDRNAVCSDHKYRYLTDLN